MKLPFMRSLLSLSLYFVSHVVCADTKLQASVVDIYNLSLAELGQLQTSIATGNNTELDKAPATATIIYAAEIEAMGANNLDEVLETVPGLHVAPSSLSRLDSIYSIRGIHTGFDPQVLLLMNGIPVQSNIASGRPVLFRLPVASIERVEIIRGPGSAIYGADAFAGVINIVTKDAESIKTTRLGVNAGSFNSRNAWLQSAGSWRDFDIAYSAAYQESDGDNSRGINTDLQSVLDSVSGTHASLAPGSLSTRYQIFDSHLALSNEHLQFNVWNWISVDAGVGAGGAQAIDPVGRDDDHVFMVDANYHFDKTSSNWDNNLRASYFYYELSAQFNLLPAGTIVPIGSDGNVNFESPAGLVSFPDGLKGNPSGKTRDTEFDYVSIYTGLDSQRIRLNVGVKYQTVDTNETKNFGPGVLDNVLLPSSVDDSLTNVAGTPYVFLPNSSRRVSYVSLQDEWNLRRNLDLTAGVRYDRYSDFGGTTNPRVALVWSGSKKLTTKLLLGSAFRAPSFAELYYQNNPVSLGDKTLNPEQITSEELSFAYRATETLQSTLTLFNYQAKKMIDFVDDPATPDTSKYARNALDQNGNGFEVEVNWKPSNHLHFGSSYSRQRATNAKTNSKIPDAPGQQFKANVNWLFANDWSVNSQLYWVADRARATNDSRPKVADYTLLNVTLNRKNILPDVDFSFAVRNAAHAHAREPSSDTIPDDYPLESRSFWVGLTYVVK